MLQRQLQEREAKKPSAYEEINEDVIYDLFAKYKEFIKSNNIPACRNFIKTYVGKVVMSPEDIKVELNVPSAYNEYSPWLKMSSAISLDNLKTPLRTTKKLIFIDSTKAMPEVSLTEAQRETLMAAQA